MEPDTKSMGSMAKQPQQRSCFLALPREIRNQIYKRYSDDSEDNALVLLHPITDTASQRPPPKICNDLLYDSALLYTCRQVFAEYREECLFAGKKTVHSFAFHQIDKHGGLCWPDKYLDYGSIPQASTVRLYIDLRDVERAVEAKFDWREQEKAKAKRLHSSSLRDVDLYNIALRTQESGLLPSAIKHAYVTNIQRVMRLVTTLKQMQHLEIRLCVSWHKLFRWEATAALMEVRASLGAKTWKELRTLLDVTFRINAVHRDGSRRVGTGGQTVFRSVHWTSKSGWLGALADPKEAELKATEAESERLVKIAREERKAYLQAIAPQSGLGTAAVSRSTV